MMEKTFILKLSGEMEEYISFQAFNRRISKAEFIRRLVTMHMNINR